MVVPFFVEAGLLLACFVWLLLEMYSRKFGLRLRGKFEMFGDRRTLIDAAAAKNQRGATSFFR
jgi:hypothetical protein